jgi:hypothetical protein
MQSGDYSVLCSAGQDCTLGTGFLVEKRLKHIILDFKAVDERMCVIRIKGKFFIAKLKQYMIEHQETMLKL